MNQKEQISFYLKKIRDYSLKINKKTTIMEICGGHTNVIMKYGIRQTLPNNINLISGPGCPVCVSSQYDIDCMIELANKGINVATYADMLKVPGSKYSLEDIKSKLGNVEVKLNAAFHQAMPITQLEFRDQRNKAVQELSESIYKDLPNHTIADIKKRVDRLLNQ